MRRPVTISARALVVAPAAPLREFVAAPDNQLALIGLPSRRLAGVVVDGDRSVVASLRLGPRREVRLRWHFESLRAATGVELVLCLPRAGLVVRALLRAGGIRWAERRMDAALAALADVARLAAADADASPATAC